MIAITISTNYSDILSHVINQNYKFFDIWIFVTHIEDNDTINLLKKTNDNSKNIIILYYDFYECNKSFNKGGALNYAQNQALSYITDEDPRILILDSDIYLPDDLMKFIPTTIPINKIYDPEYRIDFHSLYNFQNNINDNKYRCNCMGCFQLYNIYSNHFYSDSINCEKCDYEFRNKFRDRHTIKGLNIYHLGKRGINWNRRTDKSDFNTTTS